MTASARLLHDALRFNAADPALAGKSAVVTNERSHSHAELFDRAMRLANALGAKGVARGDRVAIYMENSWECVVALYAVLCAGAVFVPVNPLTRSAKLGAILDDSGARVLVTESHLAAQFVPALEQRELVAIVAGEAVAHACVSSFDALVGTTAPLDAPLHVIPTDLAALIYTSGSTGEPKGVMQTHQSMMFVAGSINEYLRQDRDTRIFSTLPLAFGYGLYQLVTAINLGASLILARSFAFPAQVFMRMRIEAPSVFPGVPTLFSMLLAAHDREPIAFPSVTTVTNAGAALPDALARRLPEIFPNARIYCMYGLTECQRVCFLDPELLAERAGSVGKAIPGTEVFLRSPEDEPLPPGSTGILHVRGPHVMPGYWRRPDLSARMLKPGPHPGESILATQDWFRMDEEGFLYFVGRSDDIIKTRGEKVSPTEVENVLYALPGVREAAVVGVPDPVLGASLRAHVVLDQANPPSLAQIRAHCVKNLEAFMVPQEIRIENELPRTASGKIRRQALKIESEAGPASPTPNALPLDKET